MVAYTKLKLSNSIDGSLIKVVATGTPGTAIHTSVALGSLDEIHLWAMNTDASAKKLTIEWGGVAAPDDLIEFTVPAEDGLYLIVPGLILTNGLLVKAFAESANVLLIGGFVNRIT